MSKNPNWVDPTNVVLELDSAKQRLIQAKADVKESRFKLGQHFVKHNAAMVAATLTDRQLAKMARELKID